MRRAAVILVALAVVAGLGVFGVSRLSNMHVPFLTDTCRVYAAEQVVRIEPDQLAHAATIVAVGVQRQLPERAATIALATALQESKLRNLDGGDRDSLGLFQQRPSQGWGTPEQLQNPRYAAGEFYTHLLKVGNWQKMRLTDAAQAVQRSGHPELYQQWEDEARAMSAAFLGAEVGAVTCQLREQIEQTGDAAAQALVAELGADLGKLSVASSRFENAPLLKVAVGGGGNSTLGWRTAHWFVAKSHDYGVQQVAHDGRVWTADSGKWKSDGTSTKGHVEVRITPDG
jgi:hypothetical protein